MNSQQIYKILHSDKDVKQLNFLGVFPIDMIPKDITFPACAVVNTKPHTHRGEHWVCFVVDRNKRGTYFNSNGYPPYNLPEIANVFRDCTEWTFNDTALQTPFSAVCGEYCIFLITHIAMGFTLEHIINILNDAGDTYANDAIVYNYIKNKYRHIIDTNTLKAVDLSFMFNQAAYSN